MFIELLPGNLIYHSLSGVSIVSVILEIYAKNKVFFKANLKHKILCLVEISYNGYDYTNIKKNALSLTENNVTIMICIR